MKNKIRLIIVLILLCTTGSLYGQKSKPYSEVDAEVYDGRIQQVKGKVVILNHPDLGKTPATGEYLVFQRDGCKDCLVATHADADGKYKVFLGVGKYKIIIQYKNCGVVTTEDCAGYNYLSADQQQHITVERGRAYTAEFNIELVLPKR